MTWNPREILIGFLQRAMKQLLFLTVAFGFSTCGDQRSWPTVGCVSSDTFYGKLAKYQTYINRAFTQFHQDDRGIDMGETEGTRASKSGMSKHLKKKMLKLCVSWPGSTLFENPQKDRTMNRREFTKPYLWGTISMGSLDIVWDFYSGTVPIWVFGT